MLSSGVYFSDGRLNRVSSCRLASAGGRNSTENGQLELDPVSCRDIEGKKVITIRLPLIYDAHPSPHDLIVLGSDNQSLFFKCLWKNEKRASKIRLDGRRRKKKRTAVGLRHVADTMDGTSWAPFFLVCVYLLSQSNRRLPTYSSHSHSLLSIFLLFDSSTAY